MELNSSPLEQLDYQEQYLLSFLLESQPLDEPFDLYPTVCPSLLANPSNGSSVAMNYSIAPDSWACPSSSVVSFDQAGQIPLPNYNPSKEQEEEYCDLWIDAMDQSYQNLNQCQNFIEDGQFLFPYQSLSSINGVQESTKQEIVSEKRPYYEETETNRGKKLRRTGETETNRAKVKGSSSNSNSPSKDTQSLAAKNRRERISERLKVLQELVPNGTKVDLVTMLEKAISYVKFLQLQVKVLATDEFWPAQGGKVPDISQVKEALDAILSSHRGQNNE